MKKVLSIIGTATVLLTAFTGLIHELRNARAELRQHEAMETGPSVEDYLLNKLRECEARADSVK